MKPSFSRLAMLAPLGFILATATGCYNKSVDGEAITYTYQLWVPTVLMLVGVLAVPGGWLLRGVSERFGYGLLIVAVLILIVGPGLFLDRVVVAPDHFSLRTGFWFYPTKHDVKWADVGRIDLTEETRSGRRGRKSTSYFLNCVNKTGGAEKVPIGTLMEEALLDVLDMAKQKDIPIIDMTSK